MYLPKEIILKIHEYKPWYWSEGAEEHIKKYKDIIQIINISPIYPWNEFRNFFVNQYKLKKYDDIQRKIYFLIWDQLLLLWRPAYVRPSWNLGNDDEGIPRCSVTCVVEYDSYDYEEWYNCWDSYWRPPCHYLSNYYNSKQKLINFQASS